MARTIVGVGDAKAVKKYSGALAIEVPREMYWGRKFMGKGETAQAPLVRLVDLESDAGEQITYDLMLQLRQKPIEGDNKQEGTEERLRTYTDQVYIDQQRGGVNAGGRMTRKRTLHNLREKGKVRLKEWWARLFDETIQCYLSGARGVNADFIEDTDWTGRANNSLTAPDANHLIVQGGKVKATLTSSETMTLGLIDKALVKAKTMVKDVPKIQPIQINGEKHYVCQMSTFQAYNLRTNTGTSEWLDLQKAAASAEGRNNMIFKGGLGMHNNVVLHEYDGVIQFSDYGSGSNLAAARALFLGRQAGAVAFGSPGTDLTFDWVEETDDRGNEVVISSSCIWGVKKTTFNGVDFGVLALDTYAADPNA